jgi:hypothetical protein
MTMQNHPHGLASAESTGVSIPVGITGVPFAPDRTFNGAHNIEALDFGCRSLLTEISAQCGCQHLSSKRPTHCSPAGNGIVPDTLVHRNVRLSGVIVCDVLVSCYWTML